MSYWPRGHFSREEFACQCGCGFDTVDYALVCALEAIRAHFDRPVRITSGCRCKKHNKSVGGSKKSQHLYGRAADINVDSIPPKLVAELAEDMGLGGVGRYETFTHLDTRDFVIRWRT